MAKDCHHHEFFKANLETEGRGAHFTCNKCRVPLQVEDASKCSRCGVMYCALCVLEYAVDSNDLERYLGFKQKEPGRKELLEGAFTLDEEYEVEDPEEDGFDIYVENIPVFVQESVVEDLPSQDEWEEVEGNQLVRTQFITEEPLRDLHSLFDDIQDELNALNEKDGSKPLYKPKKQELKEGRGEFITPPRRKGLTGLWDDLKNWMDD